MAEILVVDDESLIRDLITTSLGRLGHKLKACKSGPEALEAYEAGRYDLVISDFKMPGMTGLEMAEKLLAADPAALIILMTAYGTIETAVKAMKVGVQDFIEKDVEKGFRVEMLEHTVSQVLQIGSLKSENRRLRETLSERYKFVGASSVVDGLMKTIEEVASSNSTVMISGESGTGKELLAQAIHAKSRRSSFPFVKINCAAIPESLIESELFGHEKGAYTGAIKTRIGKFELANGGTLLLDEIGEMPLYAQSKLLRVLQEREITKIGGSDEIAIDVRIVCSTNRNLQDEVKKGNFREDLYYRLNVIPLEVPPLRDRMADIEPLAHHFIAKYNKENGFTVTGMKPDALSRLKTHSWPGNVRELENVVHRAVVFAKAGDVSVEHLRLDGAQKPAPGDSSPGLTPGMSVAEAERILIIKTLEACGENRTKAAEMLNISIRTLRNKLHEYKLQDP
ncbi:MAG TPA: sigma-54 dependent transcriptional regulator [Fibrobacteria bacterium]|nr:sigma-54 dependent transcriptional regulator [Fibrobacteria bacterium]